MRTSGGGGGSDPETLVDWGRGQKLTFLWTSQMDDPKS